MADVVSITSGHLTATIAALGAELQSLKDGAGNELMWRGDPAFWRGRAPLLFPIVGRLNGDSLRLDGQAFAMKKHGFARKSHFALADKGPDELLFRLVDVPQTRGEYPFPFELDAHFRVAGATLLMTVTVRNKGDGEMPFSFGYHPAFAWPLPGGGARGSHQIIFEVDEPSALRALTPDGLISADRVPTPVVGKTIALDDALFENDAMVWDQINSHRLIYGAPGYPRLDIVFPDTPWLGIWTKPGAPYLCVEPWAGMADPEGYKGDFRDKPGVINLAPCTEQSFEMSVTLV